MATAELPPDALKDALKKALSETLHEHRDLFREVFEEVLEDFALVEAIREGEDTKPVDRNQIMEILKESP
jgi:type I restriction-modification system DNA methylase subunit